MTVLVVGRDEMLLEWAGRQIPHAGGALAFGKATAVGIATGETEKDRLLAVAVYHDYRRAYRTCQVSIASSSPKWATRRNFRDLLAFPFLQYQCNLVWSSIPHKNERVIAFCKAIGFKQEAILADRYGPGHHAVVCRMNFKEYDKLYLKGEVHEKPARSTGTA